MGKISHTDLLQKLFSCKINNFCILLEITKINKYIRIFFFQILIQIYDVSINQTLYKRSSKEKRKKKGRKRKKEILKNNNSNPSPYLIGIVNSIIKIVKFKLPGVLK